jgi:hypothetical protein
MIPDKDREVLRRLAAEQAEIAALPRHPETIKRWQGLNVMQPARPMVLIYEMPWHECEGDDELAIQTTDPFWQGVERTLRRLLYQWKHLPVDMVVEDRIACPIVVRDSGFGLAEKSKKVFTSEGSVPSRQFEPQIREEADIEKIKAPEVTVDWERTQRRYEEMCDVFSGILPVEKRGIPGRNFNAWDALIRWWGVEQAMMDLILRPAMVHRAMDRLTNAYLRLLDQWEELGVLRLNNTNVFQGGGLGYTDELPSEGCDPSKPRARDLWGRAMAQIFSDVSPAMHEEFALQYERRWLERFGLSYYGCCEPLHLKIDILRSVKNLRKISMSPWADLDVAREKMGTDYIYSLKPNPAVLAGEWSPERARNELRQSLEKLRGCTAEIIMKDISTVGFEPRRLWEWAEIAIETAEEFA